ncbi:MAG: ATP-binding protein [Halobacteriales archaeon]|nr:ATP-binding protein [Halobacteriales archaeon]
MAGHESPLLYDEAEALVGEQVHDLFPPETADRFYGVVQKALETGDLQKIEYRLDVRAGERWFEARVVPLETRISGKRVAIWVARDITERREREQELKRQNRRLDDFASFVSHDLRNPLSVARGRLELAREECDSEHLDAVARAHERMEKLINDLLKLSRSGRPVNDVEPVRLDDVAEECWRNVETEGARLVTDTEKEVRADRSQLQHMMENLMRNSVEHCDDEVTVTVDRIDDEETDGFYVADDGPGIPEGVRDDIFESGYSTSEGGAGLGLSIVEEVAETHGWEVEVTESEEDGTRFEVTDVEFGE